METKPRTLDEYQAHARGLAAPWVETLIDSLIATAWDEAFVLGAAQSREALTVAASGLAEILVALTLVWERLGGRYAKGDTVESIEHIREAVEALRASTQAAAEGR